MPDNWSHDTVTAAFESEFARPGRVFRAPARTNIIGEHTDYNDGFVMPVNTAIYTWLVAAPRPDRQVRMHALDFDETVTIDLDDIHPDPDAGWQEYPKGVLHVLQQEGFELGGADILVTGEIPLGAGLSSSASFEVAVGFAMLSLAGHDIDRSRLALMCQAAENDFVGMSCGIMDQYVIALCEKAHAMMLDCRSLEVEFVPLPADTSMLLVDSGVTHRHREGNYNNRRQECETATARLAAELDGVVALRDVSLADLKRYRDVLDDTLYRRCRHVISDNARVQDAVQAMSNNDPESLGSIMTTAHASLRDDFEISCKELDSLVEIALGCDGVYGSRMVGGGFGGCTMTLVEASRVDEVSEKISSEYARVRGKAPWHHVVEASEPVHELVR